MTTRFIHVIACAFSICLLLGMAVSSLAQQQCSICECEYDNCPSCESCDCCPSCIEAGHGGLPPTSPRIPDTARPIRARTVPATEFNFSDGVAQPRSVAPMQQFPQSRTPPMGFSDQQAQPNFGAPATQPRSFSPTPAFSPQQNFSGQAPADNFAQSDFGGGGGGADFSAASAGAALGSDSGALTAASVAGASDSASATDGVDAPNMIGDFLNGLTTGTSIGTRIALTDFEDQGQDQVFSGGGAAASANAAFTAADAARRAKITGGFDGGTTGRVEVLRTIPGIVDAGEGGYFDTNDLTGSASGIQPRVKGTIGSELNSGSTENLNTFVRTTTTSELTAILEEPIAEEQLLEVVAEEFDNQSISISDELGDLANFVDIQFVAEESIYNNRLSVVSDVSTSILTPDSTSVSETESYQYIYDVSLTLPSANPGEFIGRANFTDNNSPLPKDRIFFDYNYFHNARIGTAQIPMNRFTPGFEKTFMDGLMSFEARLPMAITLGSTLTEGDDDVLDYELGDLAFAFKALLYQDQNRALAIGTGVTVPTADDFNARLANGTTVLSIENRTVRLTPYIGGLLTPTNKTFLQGFASVDVAASGNRVMFDQAAFDGVFNGSAPTVSSLENIGTLQASNLLKFDLTAGRWLRRNQRGRRVTDLAAVLEGHLVTSLGDPDVVSSDQIAIGEQSQTTVFNITAGTHLYFGKKDVLTLGYGVPVTEDRFFDGELRATWNRYF